MSKRTLHKALAGLFVAATASIWIGTLAVESASATTPAPTGLIVCPYWDPLCKPPIVTIPPLDTVPPVVDTDPPLPTLPPAVTAPPTTATPTTQPPATNPPTTNPPTTNPPSSGPPITTVALVVQGTPHFTG